MLPWWDLGVVVFALGAFSSVSSVAFFRGLTIVSLILVSSEWEFVIEGG